jgi:polyisoprenoid-binding protein YceI
MRRETWILAVALILLTTPLSAASERLVTFDPEATQVEFDLSATGHDVHGSFAFERGEVRWDPETGAAKGQLVVKAGAGETGNPKRDRAMHRKVLESDRFPEFVLRVERVEGELADQGTSELTLDGVLSIHGLEHPVQLAISVDLEGRHFTATGRLDVPYVAWGLHDPSMLILRVAKDVDVTVEAAGEIGGAEMATVERAPVGRGASE